MSTELAQDTQDTQDTQVQQASLRERVYESLFSDLYPSSTASVLESAVDRLFNDGVLTEPEPDAAPEPVRQWAVLSTEAVWPTVCDDEAAARALFDTMKTTRRARGRRPVSEVLLVSRDMPEVPGAHLADGAHPDRSSLGPSPTGCWTVVAR